MAGRISRMITQVLRAPVRRGTTVAREPFRPGRAPRAARSSQGATPPPAGMRVGGEFTGTPHLVYAPDADGDADPGEVVWTWVPYEEDHRIGKDRPVLVIGRDAGWLLGLMLSSRDHDGDADWYCLGAGAWDRGGRPSCVRLDRVLRVDPHHVRREGATLDRARFERVAGALRAHGGRSR